ncbi:MAG: SDR family oxidoreductase [SAR202 cluster bacterium]|jgi:NAD(P)-dependent dehydrogenase (short-subunit alcohol dehydrogenase family)|nr:short-chain dehydrogenase [Chloroflexota bacterium]MDP7231653.1 SDR family oxidoreductase [Dehalococcoidia bacterium]MQG47675.1 SDR family oxidoreductase [SAR202 cluster bacterium]|tara:strand:+ start:356 stop:1132 length:777 start_codon:yes stop_codon:yes gene_type:complete
MSGRLNGKVTLITGAGSGIGKAITHLFAAEGSSIGLMDIDQSGFNLLTEDIKKIGVEFITVEGDVSNIADCKNAVETCAKTFGKIDILVNSAGVTPRNAPKEWGFEKTWDWVVDVNLKGTVMMSKFASEIMKRNRLGSIVNLSSILGIVGYSEDISSDGFSPYTHSKGGVVQFTRDMAVQFAKDNIRVNALCPGFTYTPQTKRLTDDDEMKKKLESLHPMGRLGKPDEIAKAALFLASDESSFVTGACLPVDGGYTAK